MQIEIFVVKTELNALFAKTDKTLYETKLSSLNQIRKNLICIYEGLTQIEGNKGFWINENGKIEFDNVDIWQIFTKSLHERELRANLELLKKITNQKTQAFAIDNEISFL